MSPSPPYEQLVPVVSGVVTVTAVVFIFILNALTGFFTYHTLQVQRDITRRLEVLEAMRALPPADGWLKAWKCPACGMNGQLRTNAPPGYDLDFPCPACGVGLRLSEVATDVP